MWSKTTLLKRPIDEKPVSREHVYESQCVDEEEESMWTIYKNPIKRRPVCIGIDQSMWYQFKVERAKCCPKNINRHPELQLKTNYKNFTLLNPPQLELPF